MNANDTLHVWFENRLVGQLWRDKIGNMGFRYDKKWLNEGFPVSQQLPLSTEDFSR